jgi:hypothetical protein
MYLSRTKPWKLFETWPRAEAARLWFDAGLPLDGGTFPSGCLALVEAIAEALTAATADESVPGSQGGREGPKPQPGDEGLPEPLAAQLAALAPELTPEQLKRAWGSWYQRALGYRRSLAAPIPARDLLFAHRLRERSPAALPIGPGPWYRPVLGFGLRETPEGLLVEGIRPDGPAVAAGLAEKDLLVRVRGFACPSTNRALSALLGWQPGEALELLVRRQNKLHTLQLHPTEQREVEKLPQGEFRRRLEKLLNLRIDASMKLLGSPRVGMFCQLKEGDRLLRIDGVPVADSIELEQAIRTLDMGQFVLATVLRSGQPKVVKVVTLAFKE